MAIQLTYSLAKMKGYFLLQVEFMCVVKVKTYDVAPTPRMVIPWVKQVFPIPSDADIEFVPPTKN